MSPEFSVGERGGDVNLEGLDVRVAGDFVEGQVVGVNPCVAFAVWAKEALGGLAAG
jgi:hypothetical protein